MIGTDPEDRQFEPSEAVDALGITGWQRQAVQSLFLDPTVVEHKDNGTTSRQRATPRPRDA